MKRDIARSLQRTAKRRHLHRREQQPEQQRQHQQQEQQQQRLLQQQQHTWCHPEAYVLKSCWRHPSKTSSEDNDDLGMTPPIPTDCLGSQSNHQGGIGVSPPTLAFRPGSRWAHCADDGVAVPPHILTDNPGSQSTTCLDGADDTDARVSTSRRRFVHVKGLEIPQPPSFSWGPRLCLVGTRPAAQQSSDRHCSASPRTPPPPPPPPFTAGRTPKFLCCHRAPGHYSAPQPRSVHVSAPLFPGFSVFPRWGREPSGKFSSFRHAGPHRQHSLLETLLALSSLLVFTCPATLAQTTDDSSSGGSSVWFRTILICSAVVVLTVVAFLAHWLWQVHKSRPLCGRRRSGCCWCFFPRYADTATCPAATFKVTPAARAALDSFDRSGTGDDTWAQKASGTFIMDTIDPEKPRLESLRSQEPVPVPPLMNLPGAVSPTASAPLDFKTGAPMDFGDERCLAWLSKQLAEMEREAYDSSSHNSRSTSPSPSPSQAAGSAGLKSERSSEFEHQGSLQVQEVSEPREGFENLATATTSGEPVAPPLQDATSPDAPATPTASTLAEPGPKMPLTFADIVAALGAGIHITKKKPPQHQQHQQHQQQQSMPRLASTSSSPSGSCWPSLEKLHPAVFILGTPTSSPATSPRPSPTGSLQSIMLTAALRPDHGSMARFGSKTSSNCSDGGAGSKQGPPSFGNSPHMSKVSTQQDLA